MEQEQSQQQTCRYEPCDRKVHAKHLCAAHYMQAKAGRELHPIREYKLYAAPAPGKKVCTSCERVLDRDQDFYQRSDRQGGPLSWCKDCMRANQKLINERNKQERHAARAVWEEAKRAQREARNRN